MDRSPVSALASAVLPASARLLGSGPYCRRVVVWIDGTHGAGKTTTSAVVQALLPDANRAFAHDTTRVADDSCPSRTAADRGSP
jgi:pantothenate kinase-related protein Tda10